MEVLFQALRNSLLSLHKLKAHLWSYITGFSINLLSFYIPKGKKHTVSLQRASLAHHDNDFFQDLVG